MEREPRIGMGGGTEAPGLIKPRTILTIGAVIAGAFLATLLGLWNLATREDEAVIDRSAQIVQNAVRLIHEDIERTLGVYSHWTGKTYDQLFIEVEQHLKQAAGNTPALFSDIGIDYLYIVGPDDSIIYALRDGARTNEPLSRALPSVQPLVERARSLAPDALPATDIVAGKDAPILAAAEPLTNGADAAAGKNRPVMLFGAALTNERLSRIGSRLEIDDLHLGNEPPDDEEAATRLPSSTPSRGVSVHWRREEPGRTLFLSALPWFALGFASVAALIGLIIHQGLASARLLRASAVRLGESESRFRDVADAASDWIWETDGDRRLTYLSERFETVTGHPRSRILGIRLDEFLEADEVEKPLWSALIAQSDRVPAIRARYRDAAGNLRICRLAAKHVIGPDGETIGLRGTANDITEEVEAHQRARFLSLHDSTTGLPNRLMLGQFIDEQFAKSGNAAAEFALLYIDLDRFKPINDAFGHAAGDQVLAEIGRRLRGLAGDGNMVARVGGDEFVMVLGGMTRVTEIDALCLRLIEEVAAPIALPSGEAYVGASIGVAVAPSDSTDADELLRYADVALYDAKRGGRGLHRFFAARMKQEALGRQVLESELRAALLNDEFVLYYQPRFDPRTLAITSVEALLRWNHPKRGLVDPNEFISLAEDTGLIVPIGAWAARTACRAAQHWPGIVVAVNLSSVQFRRDDVVEMVRGALEASGLPPERLELELTESVILENSPTSREKLAALKALGLRLAMDDFGTGYSSLGYLHSYPFDRIKIDRRFMTGTDGIRDRRALLDAMLALGGALGMAITVEGVETAEQLELLRQAPCDEVQGLYLSPPLPAAVLEVKLGNDGDPAGVRSAANRP
ncbi:bifunctional diguanylate cyclase/phosphodiesterase [Segnochrobactrum spirostomi]|uniref:EAL domain-containing protein n=1 Tax=Segnochrobactrum spirostomi TaxID=2608987 RepID=A0A6A7Y272_9HYPH|nr:EAL domain-containing protein [Segnochrobactrum spirostomi]MQT11949.1 EAL domain-containing protein [Segnochrobactrum spirostomi]